MSASSKPSPHAPSTERVARALIDAEVLGDKRAAARHKVHHRTIEDWRKKYRDAPLVEAAMKALYREVREGWIDEFRDARRKILYRVIELADDPDAKLPAVTDALRRVSDIIAVDDVLNDADGDDGGSGPVPPEAAVAGEGPPDDGDPPPFDEDDPD